MFPYIKEIQKRNIDIGQGQSRVGVLDLGSGASIDLKRWKRQEERQKVWQDEWNVHEMDEGRWAELSGPVSSLPSYSTTSSSSFRNKVEFQFYKQSNAAASGGRRDLIGWVKPELEETKTSSEHISADKHGGGQDGPCSVFTSTSNI